MYVYRTLENVPRVPFNRDLGLPGYSNQNVGERFVIYKIKEVTFNLDVIVKANFTVLF